MTLRSRITGVGAYVPPRVVTNHDLEKMLDTSDEWIVQRSGIQQRRWVEPETSTSDLAFEASKAAIADAGLTKDDIDMIVFATLSPDHDFPGTGCFLQAKLDRPTIPVFDIRQQCTGFVYGLSLADSFVRTGQAKNVLVVGAEIHSKGLNKTPAGRDVSVLFGDGAGAVVISACEVNDPKKDAHIISSALHADGSFAKELWIPAPGNALVGDFRINSAALDEGLHYPKMNGKTVFTHAVKRMSETLASTLAASNVGIADVDLFLFHQANIRINDKVGEMMGIPADKVFNTIQNYGNTTAATIPLGMRDAIKAGKLRPGMLVGMAAFGSGFTWASALMRF
jgi:3-oxoacyl-[acyl-carrier-protein] synthase-3